MRFGLLCSAQAIGSDPSARPGQGLRDWIDFNVQAERLGFAATFLVERDFTGWDQVSATLTVLACLAMRTTTLRVGSGVLALPWHNPVLLAEQAATVDLVSGGRLDLGIGKGYRHAEFAGFTRAAVGGYRLILDQYASPAQIADRIALYRDRLTARPFQATDVAVARHLHIADNDAETAAAHRRLAASTDRILGVSRHPGNPASGSHVLAYQQPGAAGAHALYGTPAQVAAGLTALQDAGAAYVLLIPESDVDQLRRFREDVIPYGCGSPVGSK
jgi:alkanesulfonate monooxygenase SsuD/methylene tetrahydromethanopterin reductase-like flavin-dependent oxidoreductase (luciferase family)